jgi:hypothetical protein
LTERNARQPGDARPHNLFLAARLKESLDKHLGAAIAQFPKE